MLPICIILHLKNASMTLGHQQDPKTLSGQVEPMPEKQVKKWISKKNAFKYAVWSFWWLKHLLPTPKFPIPWRQCPDLSKHNILYLELGRPKSLQSLRASARKAYTCYTGCTPSKLHLEDTWATFFAMKGVCQKGNSNRVCVGKFVVFAASRSACTAIPWSLSDFRIFFLHRHFT